MFNLPLAGRPLAGPSCRVAGSFRIDEGFGGSFLRGTGFALQAPRRGETLVAQGKNGRTLLLRLRNLGLRLAGGLLSFGQIVEVGIGARLHVYARLNRRPCRASPGPPPEGT